MIWLIGIALTVLVFLSGRGILSNEDKFHLAMRSMAMMDQEAYEENILYTVNGRKINKFLIQRQELLKVWRRHYEQEKSHYNYGLLVHELVNIGDLMREAGNYDGAVQSYKEILSILDGYDSQTPDGQLRDRANICIRLARVMNLMNKHNEAIQYSRTAMEIEQALAEKNGSEDQYSLIKERRNTPCFSYGYISRNVA